MQHEILKKDFSNEEVIKVLAALGSEDYKRASENALIFKTVCHHGESYKLYYYIESKLFHCYTDCGDSFDIYELVKRSLGCSFFESINYINGVLGLHSQKIKGFVKATPTLTDDWDTIKKIGSMRRKKNSIEMHRYPKTLIGYYTKTYPIEWLNENISEAAMDKYNIRFDIANNKIVIPQYDENGNLIGIRARSLNIEDVEQKRKYMPCIIEDTIFRHPTQYSLYGLYQNKETIQRVKKVVIFEAEKSVLKCESYYQGNNFTVAVCGSHISSYQRNMLLNLGVKEVMIAFDKEYHDPNSEEAYEYADKILSLAYIFCPYVTTFILWDTEGLLGYKDSPADRGKDILEKLMKEKYEIVTKED